MILRFIRSSSTARIRRPFRSMDGFVSGSSIDGFSKHETSREGSRPEKYVDRNPEPVPEHRITKSRYVDIRLALPPVPPVRWCHFRRKPMPKSFVFSSESVGEGHPD